MYDHWPTRYSYGPFTWTTTDETISIQGPKGKAGLLYDYGVYGVTTAFAGGTTTPIMSIGTPSDADAYGDDYDFSTLADNSGKSIRSTYRPGVDAGWDTYMVERDIPADQEVVMKLIVATGGGAAGVSMAFCDIIWAL